MSAGPFLVYARNVKNPEGTEDRRLGNDNFILKQVLHLLHFLKKKWEAFSSPCCHDKYYARKDFDIKKPGLSSK